LNWTDLSSDQKREAVRDLVEEQGATYGEAASLLGTNRSSIAGVVDRSRNAKEGRIKSKSAQQTVKDQKPKKQKVLTVRKKFRKFVASYVPPTLDVQPTVLRADAWMALEGSSPIAIEDHTTGCRWPIGQPVLFCNEPVQTDKPYCQHHCARAYKETPPLIRERKNALV
jgi:hypothetical protein